MQLQPAWAPDCAHAANLEQRMVGPHSQFGIMGLQGKNLGLWDYTVFEIGITEISYEIGIMDLKFNQIGIFHSQ